MKAARTRRWLLLSLTTLAVAWPTFAPAQVSLTSDQLQSLEREIGDYQALVREREAEIAAIERALGETAAALRQRLSERDAVSAEIIERRRERELVEANIRDLDQQRQATEARIAGLQRRLSEMRVRVAEMLVNVYKQRGHRLGTAFAGSESFHELRVRNYYLSLLAEQDATIMTELDSLLAELNSAQQALAAQLAELSDAQAQLLAAESELAATQARLERLVADLNSTEQGQQAQRQALLTEQTRLERSLDDLGAQFTAELERLRLIEAQARADAEQFAQDRERQLAAQREADQARLRIDALTAPVPPLTSGLIRPLDGAELLTRFGEGNNSYLAIRAPVANAAVRAVGPGRVEGLTYLGANFGYMVAIYHADGLVSIYANLRQPLVQLFEVVEQGRILGYLGGGTLTRGDILQFYAKRDSGSGPFIDPAPLLGW